MRRAPTMLVIALATGCPSGPDALVVGDGGGEGSSGAPMPDVPGPTRAPSDAGTSDAPTRAPGPDVATFPDLGAPPPVDPPPHFTDVTAAAGLATAPPVLRIAPFCLLDDREKPAAGDFCVPERFLGAAAAADYDGDGWVDLYLTASDGPDRLMHNRGDGTFEDVTAAAGLGDAFVTGDVRWADIDGDGDLDLLRSCFAGPANLLHIHDGDGHFSEEAAVRGFADATGDAHVGTGLGVGDYDRDGWLDVFVADWHPDDPLGPAPEHVRLLHNLGEGVFEDVTEAMAIAMRPLAPLVDAKPGTYGFAPAFVDLDGDDWPELALTSDFGTSRLWWNDAGVLLDTTFASGLGSERNGMGSTFGDYDGDGDLDWFVSAIATDEFPQLGNRMYRYDGARGFTDVTDVLGLREGGWAWGAAFVDVDHDGDLDLVQTAGWPAIPFDDDPIRLWRNDGADGVWPEIAGELGLTLPSQSRGVIPLDLDGDGDLDLLVTSNHDGAVLYRNDAAHGHWLVVAVDGPWPNTQGLGAKVRVQAEPDGPWQTREIGVGTHLYGQSESVAHFGLDDDASVHRVEVRWPDGEVRVLEDVDADQRLRVAP